MVFHQLVDVVGAYSVSLLKEDEAGKQFVRKEVGNVVEMTLAPLMFLHHETLIFNVILISNFEHFYFIYSYRCGRSRGRTVSLLPLIITARPATHITVSYGAVQFMVYL